MQPMTEQYVTSTPSNNKRGTIQVHNLLLPLTHLLTLFYFLNSGYIVDWSAVGFIFKILKWTRGLSTVISVSLPCHYRSERHQRDLSQFWVSLVWTSVQSGLCHCLAFPCSVVCVTVWRFRAVWSVSLSSVSVQCGLCHCLASTCGAVCVTV